MSVTKLAIRKAPSNFPYTDPTTAYFLVEDGNPVPIEINKSTVGSLSDTDPQLWAVWPGRVRSSDMFLVDKLKVMKAFLSTASRLHTSVR